MLDQRVQLEWVMHACEVIELGDSSKIMGTEIVAGRDLPRSQTVESHGSTTGVALLQADDLPELVIYGALDMTRLQRFRDFYDVVTAQRACGMDAGGLA